MVTMTLLSRVPHTVLIHTPELDAADVAAAETADHDNDGAAESTDPRVEQRDADGQRLGNHSRHEGDSRQTHFRHGQSTAVASANVQAVRPSGRATETVLAAAERALNVVASALCQQQLLQRGLDENCEIFLPQ